MNIHHFYYSFVSIFILTIFLDVSTLSTGMLISAPTVSSSISNITRNLEMFRFDSNNADLSNIAKANIYYCKIWDGSDLVMDLHPYLIDEVPCMVNEVDGVEFYNAGTGQFEYA